MSWLTSEDPIPGDAKSCDAIETVIVPRSRDLGGFEVRRALPSAQRRMVGPFIFFDQMGPAEFLTGAGIDVRPHPHIGLSTVTYLFSGAIDHKDSLGTAMTITPGDVNWMTSGRGIVHSERTGPEEKAKPHELFGIQSWVALPRHMEETAPAFAHTGRKDLPMVRDTGAEVRVIAGEVYGARSPVVTATDMFYADVALAAGRAIPLDAGFEERAVYTLSGEVEIAGQGFGPGQLLVFKPGDRIMIRAARDARFLILGGEPMDGERYIWWNFVSSSRERIEQAKEDWRQRRFDIVPGDEADFIPLPDEPPGARAGSSRKPS